MFLIAFVRLKTMSYLSLKRFLPVSSSCFIDFLFLKPFINELILGIIFAVVCGIMIYISLDELIPSSRKYGYTGLSVASIFLFCARNILFLLL